jgi:hypothetical protein
VESQRLFATEGEVLVASSLFLLQEDGGTLDLTEIEGPGDGVATGGVGGAILWSACNDHYPQVRVELWSGPPPRSEQEWEATQDEAISVWDTGRLAVTTIFGTQSDASGVRLPRLGSYQVRVHARGREEARGHGRAEFFHGIEQWLLQVWPPA